MDAKEQFNNQAKFYSSSKTFSTGESLDILSNLFNKKNLNLDLILELVQDLPPLNYQNHVKKLKQLIYLRE